MPSDPGFTTASPNHDLETAHWLEREGRLAEAEQAYRRILAAQPEQTAALRFLANMALARNAPGEAIELLNRAANLDRNDIGVLLELGVAYRNAERMDAARYVLDRVLELSQGRHTAARLLLASVLQLDQRPELALAHYFRAILDAQQAGNWLDDNSTEPSLRPLVRHAMRYVTEGRRALFDSVLQPLRHGVDSAGLDRIDRALAIYLRDRHEPTSDPRQRPSFLYVPDLGASPVIDNSRFSWLGACLTRIATTATEVDVCLAPPLNAEGFDASAFNLGNSMRTEASHGEGATSRERRASLYRRGMLLEATRRNAPQMLAALANVPLVHIPRHGPDAEIIALPPAMRTALYHGRTNSRCSAVIALPGSARMDVIIGGERYDLDDGDALVFDTSFSVEYANGGKSEARVLTFEIWHPDLTPLEHEALTALTSAIVDFDTQLQELA